MATNEQIYPERPLSSLTEPELANVHADRYSNMMYCFLRFLTDLPEGSLSRLIPNDYAVRVILKNNDIPNRIVYLSVTYPYGADWIETRIVTLDDNYYDLIEDLGYQQERQFQTSDEVIAEITRVISAIQHYQNGSLKA